MMKFLTVLFFVCLVAIVSGQFPFFQDAQQAAGAAEPVANLTDKQHQLSVQVNETLQKLAQLNSEIRQFSGQGPCILYTQLLSAKIDESVIFFMVINLGFLLGLVFFTLALGVRKLMVRKIQKLPEALATSDLIGERWSKYVALKRFELTIHCFGLLIASSVLLRTINVILFN